MMNSDETFWHFHEISKNRKMDFQGGMDLPESIWKKVYFKRYPRLESIELPNTEPSLSSEKLTKLLSGRRSVREYLESKITLEQLSYLLRNSFGINNNYEDLDDSRRTYPSAGARYPTEVYPVILNGEDIAKGIYHYNVKENVLEKLKEGDFTEKIKDLILMDIDIEDASMVLLITSVLRRSIAKYGERGYRYSLIETGHVGQNIYLTSSAMNLGTVAIGGFEDEVVNKLLELENSNEEPTYMFVIGKPANYERD